MARDHTKSLYNLKSKKTEDNRLRINDDSVPQLKNLKFDTFIELATFMNHYVEESDSLNTYQSIDRRDCRDYAVTVEEGKMKVYLKNPIYSDLEPSERFNVYEIEVNESDEGEIEYSIEMSDGKKLQNTNINNVIQDLVDSITQVERRRGNVYDHPVSDFIAENLLKRGKAIKDKFYIEWVDEFGMLVFTRMDEDFKQSDYVLEILINSAQWIRIIGMDLSKPSEVFEILDLLYGREDELEDADAEVIQERTALLTDLLGGCSSYDYRYFNEEDIQQIRINIAEDLFSNIKDPNISHPFFILLYDFSLVPSDPRFKPDAIQLERNSKIQDLIADGSILTVEPADRKGEWSEIAEVYNSNKDYVTEVYFTKDEATGRKFLVRHFIKVKYSSAEYSVPQKWNFHKKQIKLE